LIAILRHLLQPIDKSITHQTIQAFANIGACPEVPG
jgi:hypothetical protein